MSFLIFLLLLDFDGRETTTQTSFKSLEAHP